MLKFFHVFEGILIQAVPLPYFFNMSHLAFYITIMLVGLIFLKYQKSITSQKIELALLFLIFSIPLAINSELRIAITSSYFIISLVFLSVRSNNFSKLFLLIFIAHNMWVTTISKKNYFSGEYSLENHVAGPENGFYNNDFYKKKRAFLIKAKENIKKY